MIEAQIKSIIPGGSGRDAKAFARSRALISPENLSGEVMFYAAPPFWTGGRPPHVGQQVLIGHLERKTSPHWPHPRWLAREVSSAYAIRQYSPNRLREETTQSTSLASGTWIERLLTFIRLRAGKIVSQA